MQYGDWEGMWQEAVRACRNICVERLGKTEIRNWQIRNVIQERLFEATFGFEAEERKRIMNIGGGVENCTLNQVRAAGRVTCDVY
jgi:hypothetical protein